jgi:phosphoribosylglycinamide formyltransferase 2
VLIDADTANLSFTQVESALQEPDTALRLFGKPEVRGHRRMGVTLARADSVERARDVARDMAERLVAGARP